LDASLRISAAVEAFEVICAEARFIASAE